MSDQLDVSYHTHGPNEFERGTAVQVREQSTCVVVGIGEGGKRADLSIYVYRAAEAFALAKAFAAAGEVLERRSGATRAAEVPAATWTEPELPIG